MQNMKRSRRSRRALSKFNGDTSQNQSNMLDSALCWVRHTVATLAGYWFCVAGLYNIFCCRNVFTITASVVARRCSGPVCMCEKVLVKVASETVLWFVILGKIPTAASASHCRGLNLLIGPSLFSGVSIWGGKTIQQRNKSDTMDISRTPLQDIHNGRLCKVRAVTSAAKFSKSAIPYEQLSRACTRIHVFLVHSLCVTLLSQHPQLLLQCLIKKLPCAEQN